MSLTGNPQTEKIPAFTHVGLGQVLVSHVDKKSYPYQTSSNQVPVPKLLSLLLGDGDQLLAIVVVNEVKSPMSASGSFSSPSPTSWT
jgi:hypothetical protein